MGSRVRRTARVGVVSALLVGSLALGVPSAGATVPASPARTWGTNGRVLAVLPIGDQLFVGGTFTSVVDTSGVSYPAANLAAFDAATGAVVPGFGVGTNATVTSLATDGASLFVGGAFGKVTVPGSSYPRSGIASVDLNGFSVRTWAPSATGGQVDALAFSAATGSVYAAGNFTAFAGQLGALAKSRFVAKVATTTGYVDQRFLAAPNGRVRALALASDTSGRLFLGGDFTAVAGTSRRSVAAVSRATGGYDATWKPGPTNLAAYSPVYDMAADGSRLYLAAAGGGGACTALSLATGARVWSDHSTGNLQSVRVVGSSLYCAGHFSGTASFRAPDGTAYSREKLARVDAATGAVDALFSPRVNSALGVWALGSQPGDPNVYVGGDFTAISGVRQPHLAVFVDSSQQTVPTSPGIRAEAEDGVVHLLVTPPSTNGGSPVQSVKIYRSTTSGGEKLTGGALVTLKGTATLADDTAVTNGTLYYYVAVAVNAHGASEPSAEASASPTAGLLASLPGAATYLQVQAPAGFVHVSWNPPASDGGAPVTSYLVRRTAPSAQAATLTVSANQFDDLYGVVAGETYCYQVAALNHVGAGPFSAKTVCAVATAGPPGPPVLSGTTGPSTVSLTWTEAPNGGTPIVGYEVFRNGVRVVTLPATSLSWSSAQTSGSWAFQVRAVGSLPSPDDRGQFSNRVTLAVP